MGQAVAVEFSVLIPTHNRPDALRRAVESVCRQSYADFELIVVDDGCDEPVSQVLGALKDPRVTVLRQDRGGGVSSARNAGIACARGRLVSFLDDDDLFHRDYLARVREAFAEPSAGFAWVAQAIVVGESAPPQWLTTRQLRPFPPIRLVPHSDLANIYVGCAQGLTVRRSALEEVGPFDERLSYSEDFDLVVRLVAANWQAWRLNMPLIVHAVHQRGGLSNAPTRKRCLALMRVMRRNKPFLESRPGAYEHLLRCAIRDLVHSNHSARGFRLIGYARRRKLRHRWIRKVTINSYFFAMKRLLAGRPVKTRWPGAA